MIEDIAWDQGAIMAEIAIHNRLKGVTDAVDAYRMGFDDAYLNILTETGDPSEEERRTWNISSGLLKLVCFDWLGGKTIREAYDLGERHALTFDHKVLQTMAEMGVIRQRCLVLQ